MDVDDVVKVLIPKSQRKTLKRRLKKQGLIGLLLDFMRAFIRLFSNGNKSQRSIPNPISGKTSLKAKEQDPLVENLVRAQTYGQKINGLAQSAEKGSLQRLRLEQLSERVTEWVEKLEAIVSRALTQEDDAVLAAERKRVPKAIKRLEKQLADTEDAYLKEKLQLTLENRRKQLVQLEQAANQRQMVELKVENTLAQLGIIYTQLHSGQYLLKRSRYERLASEIADEVEGLNDYLATLHELQQPQVP